MTTPRLTPDEIDLLRRAQTLLRRYAQDWTKTTHDDRVAATDVADALRSLTANLGYRLVPVPEHSVTARLDRIEQALRLLTNHFDITYVHDSGGPV
jgi:hypothetical protein